MPLLGRLHHLDVASVEWKAMINSDPIILQCVIKTKSLILSPPSHLTLLRILHDNNVGGNEDDTSSHYFSLY